MENWKDKIMNSLEGVEPVRPREGVFLKIEKTISEQTTDNSNERRQRVAIAAAIALITCSNIFFISNYFNKRATTNTSEIYPQVISNYNIYEE